MSRDQRKAVIIAPFWRMPGHVGNYRVDRFRRWLIQDGYTVVVVRGGTVDCERQESWGFEITVRDPLSLHPDPVPGSASVKPLRKPNRRRRAVANWIFNPDAAIVWAHAAAKHPAVLRASEGATLVLSSSPPESCHVAAWLLSRRLGVAHVMDLRDGWLDEPLKPELVALTIRRLREGRWEKRIASNAVAIQVSSDVWKELLCERFPHFASKVHIVTNAYPPNYEALLAPGDARVGPPRRLIHAGRFLGSRKTQLPEILLTPLLDHLGRHPSNGVVQLVGTLDQDELSRISAFTQPYKRIGWEILCSGAVPRERLFEMLREADGLLLLSASHAALPSKLFEYIPLQKPIFVVTQAESATWRVCRGLPQATLVDMRNLENNETPTGAFFDRPDSAVPRAFTEHFIQSLFSDIVKTVTSQAGRAQ